MELLGLDNGKMQEINSRLQEAKALKKHYDKLGVTDCYCGESSPSECPLHIYAYIQSLEKKLK